MVLLERSPSTLDTLWFFLGFQIIGRIGWTLLFFFFFKVRNRVPKEIKFVKLTVTNIRDFKSLNCHIFAFYLLWLLLGLKFFWNYRLLLWWLHPLFFIWIFELHSVFLRHISSRWIWFVVRTLVNSDLKSFKFRAASFFELLALLLELSLDILKVLEHGLKDALF